MITNRRWAIQILRDILRHMAELEGLSKGQIRIITGLNFYQAQSYLNFLEERGFVAELDNSSASTGGPLLSVTTTGRQLLSLIDGLLSFMELNDAEELPESSPGSPKSGSRETQVPFLS